MHCRALSILSAFALLGGIELWGRFDTRLLAAQDSVPRARDYFSLNLSGDTATAPARMAPITPFPNVSSTILIGANIMVCAFDGATGRTSLPLQVYDPGTRGPINFAATRFRNQLVVFVGPGGVSNYPMAGFVFGSPHQSLGDFGMIDRGHQHGVSLAAGNAYGDDTPELFLGTAKGGPGVLHLVSPGVDQVTSFSPFGSGYSGGMVLATGDINGDRFDELMVGQRSGGDVRVYTFVDGQPSEIGGGYPLGPVTQLTIDLFDVNNDNREEFIFAAGGNDPLVRIVGLDNNEAGLYTQFRPSNNGVTAVAGALVNGAANVVLTNQDGYVEAWNRLILDTHERHLRALPFGASQQPAEIFIQALLPPAPPAP